MTVAKQVIDKCGGIKRTAELCGQSESWVYRWTYPTSKGGTGGRIPPAAQIALLEAASRGDVNIKPDDFFPKMAGASSS